MGPKDSCQDDIAMLKAFKEPKIRANPTERMREWDSSGRVSMEM